VKTAKAGTKSLSHVEEVNKEIEGGIDNGIESPLLLPNYAPLTM
jgi:hypothetical protein